MNFLALVASISANFLMFVSRVIFIYFRNMGRILIVADPVLKILLLVKVAVSVHLILRQEMNNN